MATATSFGVVASGASARPAVILVRTKPGRTVITCTPHPYSASVVLDGVGHWLFQERPAEFNALVLGWIDGLPAA